MTVNDFFVNDCKWLFEVLMTFCKWFAKSVNGFCKCKTEFCKWVLKASDAQKVSFFLSETDLFTHRMRHRVAFYCISDVHWTLIFCLLMLYFFSDDMKFSTCRRIHIILLFTEFFFKIVSMLPLKNIVWRFVECCSIWIPKSL